MKFSTSHKFSSCLWLGALSGLVASAALAAIVGTNEPAQGLTRERIAAAGIKPARMEKYLAHSEEQWRSDHAAFVAEMRKNKVEVTSSPPASGSARSIPMNQPAAWYAEPEAKRIADIIVSFQTPAGGWSKNLDLTNHVRAPGEYYSGDSRPMHLTPADNDFPRELNWHYVGTFDNDATTTELRFLARVIAAHPVGGGKKYRPAFQRGLQYIFAAQYPNGGWPQVWPLEGGYHDAITYNDDAMIHVMKFLKDVSAGAGEFAFVAPNLRRQASSSVRRGIECVLATQIKEDGHPTVWCQQHDPLTLAPSPARNYEMPSRCGAESSEIVLFLMGLPNPDARTVAAVHAAANWFKKTQIRDMVWEAAGDGERKLTAKPGGGPLWARYYDLKSDRPIFGDRDKTIHDNVNDLSQERRKGYSWFSAAPQRALDRYAIWSKEHPNSNAPKPTVTGGKGNTT